MKHQFKKFLILLISSFAKLFSGNSRSKLMRLLAESLDLKFLSQEKVNTNSGSLSFLCENDLLRWRIETFFTKEPETLEWIDSFNEGDIFWDIGANIGLYSLYAAKVRNCQVLSFEPASQNYSLLNEHINLNGLNNKIEAFCVALCDKTRIDKLKMQMFTTGGSMSSFGVSIDHNGNNFTPVFEQGMIGITLDDFTKFEGVTFPNHIKIDVDGIEELILQGGPSTLSDNRLKSLLLEMDFNRHDYSQSMIDVLSSHGLELYSKKQSPDMVGGKFANLFNCVFMRKEM